MTKHINLSEIISYFSGHADENETPDLELHLANCDRCKETVSKYHLISAHFEKIWPTLSLDDMMKDLTRIRLLESLLSSDIKSELLPRIITWIKHFYNKTNVIVGMAFDNVKKTTSTIKDDLLSAGFFGNMPRFQPAFAPRVRGDKGPDAVQRQKMDGPTGEKMEIYHSEDGLQIKIITSKTEPPLPLIWAVSIDKGISVFKETYHPEETDYIVAEFSSDELADLSEYIFLLECDPAE